MRNHSKKSRYSAAVLTMLPIQIDNCIDLHLERTYESLYFLVSGSVSNNTTKSHGILKEGFSALNLDEFLGYFDSFQTIERGSTENQKAQEDLFHYRTYLSSLPMPIVIEYEGQQLLIHRGLGRLSLDSKRESFPVLHIIIEEKDALLETCITLLGLDKCDKKTISFRILMASLFYSLRRSGLSLSAEHSTGSFDTKTVRWMQSWSKYAESSVQAAYLLLAKEIDDHSLDTLVKLDDEICTFLMAYFPYLSFQDSRKLIDLIYELDKLGTLDRSKLNLKNQIIDLSWVKKTLSELENDRFPRRKKREADFARWKQKILSGNKFKRGFLKPPRDFEGKDLTLEIKIESKADIDRLQKDFEYLGENWDEFERILFKAD